MSYALILNTYISVIGPLKVAFRCVEGGNPIIPCIQTYISRLMSNQNEFLQVYRRLVCSLQANHVLCKSRGLHYASHIGYIVVICFAIKLWYNSCHKINFPTLPAIFYHLCFICTYLLVVVVVAVGTFIQRLSHQMFNPAFNF